MIILPHLYYKVKAPGMLVLDSFKAIIYVLKAVYLWQAWSSTQANSPCCTVQHIDTPCIDTVCMYTAVLISYRASTFQAFMTPQEKAREM